MTVSSTESGHKLKLDRRPFEPLATKLDATDFYRQNTFGSIPFFGNEVLSDNTMSPCTWITSPLRAKCTQL